MKRSTVLMCVFWGTVIIVSASSNALHATATVLQVQFLTIILIYASAYNWFIQDTKENGLVPSKGLQFGVATAASLCVPYYLIRYKGWKRASYSAVRFSGMFAVSAVLTGLISL
jgi:hypothetical protein